MKRTPGKWRHGKGSEASKIFLDDPQGGPSKTVAELWYHGWTRAEIQEHTEHIIRACNAHDALVAAAQEMLDAWDSYEMLAALDYRIRERVQAAIALATEAPDANA